MEFFRGSLEGPAIIKQHDTSTVPPPGFRAAVDDAGNLTIDAPGLAPG